jgi:hypothetical protein
MINSVSGISTPAAGQFQCDTGAVRNLIRKPDSTALRTRKALYHGQAQARPPGTMGNKRPDTGVKQVRGETGAIITDVQVQVAVDEMAPDDNPAARSTQGLGGIEKQVQ